MKKISVSNQDTKITAPKAKAPRKPKASVGNKPNTPVQKSPMRKTRTATPRKDAASSFMRTTAFTMQSKIRSAISPIKRPELPVKAPLGKFMNLSFESSIHPSTNGSWLGRPVNRLKLAFAVAVICSLGAFAGYSEHFSDSARTIGSWFGDKVWVEGMLTQTNGIPEDNELPGTLLPARDAAPSDIIVVKEDVSLNAGTDALPVESALEQNLDTTAMMAPAATIAKPAAVKLGKKSSSSKKAKTLKNKTSKTKAKNKSKVANK